MPLARSAFDQLGVDGVAAIVAGPGGSAVDALTEYCRANRQPEAPR